MGAPGEDVGYKRPPRSTQFQKGSSGNPKGRPRHRRRELPYDALLGQMVTIREEGRERRVTAAEAFLLHLTKRGLEGDNAAARASLTAMEAARSGAQHAGPDIETIVYRAVSPGSVGLALDALGMATKLNRYSDNARYKLKPWIVQAALERLGERRLSTEEQAIVVEVTYQPEKVRWPEWWTVGMQ